MGFVSALARTVLDMGVVTLLIMFLPGFPPYTSFTHFQLPESPDWSGPLQPNTKLNLVDRLFENQIKGPESFAIRDGFLYTGLMSGFIVRIDLEDLSISPVAKIGSDCDGQYEDIKCGRPLGLQFTGDGDLLVCDAVFGLYLIKFHDEDEQTVGRITSFRHRQHVSYEQLLSPESVVDGHKNVLFNSVVLDKDNKSVYLTVSSTKFPLRNGMFELISDGTGRVLRFDLETRQVQVILGNLSFANGIDIDSKGEYLLVAETGRSAIHKIFLSDERRFESKKLNTLLPGLPDNIRVKEDGKFYVGIISPRIPNTWHLLDLAAPHNLLRKFISRLIHMVLMPVKLLNSVIPMEATLKFEYWCGNLEPFAQLSKPYGLLVEMDGETGQIISSLHSTNGAVRFISDGIVVGRWIYLGSPYTNYLARIPTRLLNPASSELLDIGLHTEEQEEQKQDGSSDELEHETVDESDSDYYNGENTKIEL